MCSRSLYAFADDFQIVAGCKASAFQNLVEEFLCRLFEMRVYILQEKTRSLEIKRRLNLDFKSTGIKPRFSPSATSTKASRPFYNDTRLESVDSLVYLGVLVNGTCTSSDEISRRLTLAQSAFG